MRALLAAALLLLTGAAPAKKALPNGWLALYDLARREGTVWSKTANGSMTRLPTLNGEIWVPKALKDVPMISDTCQIRMQGVRDYPPELDAIPGFLKSSYALEYDDKGCTGNFAAIRPSSARISTGQKEIDLAKLRYMRGWLTKPIFDYLGLVYLQATRQYLHKE